MSTDPTGIDPRRLRASDPERERTAQLLRAAMTEGRLSLPEAEQRLGDAYAARYRDELAPLVADLPDGGRAALAGTPEARDYARRAARRHAGLIAVVAAVLIGAWALSDARFFWPAIPLFFLTAGLIRRVRFGRYAYAYRDVARFRPRRHQHWH